MKTPGFNFLWGAARVSNGKWTLDVEWVNACWSVASELVDDMAAAEADAYLHVMEHFSAEGGSPSLFEGMVDGADIFEAALGDYTRDASDAGGGSQPKKGTAKPTGKPDPKGRGKKINTMRRHFWAGPSQP